jgi:isopropylmalate/homocitrate/citramalate synthase
MASSRSDLIWTGAVNEPYAIGGSVGLYDTTLRDGEQTVGVVLDPQQKLELARAIDSLGIERIEAGFPRVSQDDWDAVKLIAGAGLDAEVWGFSRAVAADVEALAELGVLASVIESPISDAKLAALGVSRESMLERIRNAVSFAAEHGITVAYFGVDGTRADLEFFRQAYETAVEAGAKEAVVVDTIGLATAAAAAAVRAGATWIQGTINGMGERGGNANLIEVALTLDALYGVGTNLRLDRARAVSHVVAEVSGTPLEAWKPVVGENLFRRESGAVASQFHDPPAIEPYSSELVGAERSVVLGKKSGIDSIRIAVERLGLDVPEEQWPGLLEQVKALGAEKRGLVTDEELEALVRLRER